MTEKVSTGAIVGIGVLGGATLLGLTYLAMKKKQQALHIEIDKVKKKCNETTYEFPLMNDGSAISTILEGSTIHVKVYQIGEETQSPLSKDITYDIIAKPQSGNEVKIGEGSGAEFEITFDKDILSKTTSQFSIYVKTTNTEKPLTSNKIQMYSNPVFILSSPEIDRKDCLNKVNYTVEVTYKSGSTVRIECTGIDIEKDLQVSLENAEFTVYKYSEEKKELKAIYSGKTSEPVIKYDIDTSGILEDTVWIYILVKKGSSKYLTANAIKLIKSGTSTA